MKELELKKKLEELPIFGFDTFQEIPDGPSTEGFFSRNDST